MKLPRTITAAVLLAAAFCPAFAAEAIFPPGLRVGLTPPAGLALAKTFPGFETMDHGVKVLLAELPAQAYAEVVNAIKANPATTTPSGTKPEAIETAAGPAYYTTEAAKDGAASVRRYSMILSGGAIAG